MLLSLQDQLTGRYEPSLPTNIKMPLFEREAAKASAFAMFRSNLEQHGKPEKNLHTFYSIEAGSGCGKSRTCYEMKSWWEEFVKENPKVIFW
jgi:7-cyano-7-deazaguanine synthase in queuosine biosynthesis